jgi:hypothetical protein
MNLRDTVLIALGWLWHAAGWLAYFTGQPMLALGFFGASLGVTLVYFFLRRVKNAS